MRVEEYRALTQCHEFKMLSIYNQMHIKTTSGCASILNHIIERPNRENYIKNRISLGFQPKFPKEPSYFSRQHVTLVKLHMQHTSVNSIPSYKWCDQSFNYQVVRFLVAHVIVVSGVREK